LLCGRVEGVIFLQCEITILLYLSVFYELRVHRTLGVLAFDCSTNCRLVVNRRAVSEMRRRGCKH